MKINNIQCLEPDPSFPEEKSYYEQVIEDDKSIPEYPKYDAEQIRRYATDTDLRKYITYSFIFNITCWLAGVLTILYFNNYLFKLKLSEPVLITLLTTSTLNVIGTMMIMLKNLFPLQTEPPAPQSVGL